MPVTEGTNEFPNDNATPARYSVGVRSTVDNLFYFLRGDALRYLLVTVGNALVSTQSCMIASGTAVSSAIDLAGWSPLRIVMPAAWDLANLTLLVSQDNVTYVPVYLDDGTEYVIAAAASRAIVLDPGRLPGVRYLQLRSGTAATPVNQTAARTLTIITKPL